MPEAMAGKGLQDCGLIGRLGGWTSGILENTVMVCNGTVWRRTVPVFIQESEGRNCFMSQIRVNNLTFCYEGSFDNIFEDISFSIDTNWKLGFIGRNGKGKTTFLNLLL